MTEFLQTYGIWLFLGVFLLLMVWRRGHGGMGCGMGGHRHDRDHSPDTGTEEEGPSQGSHRSGCH